MVMMMIVWLITSFGMYWSALSVSHHLISAVAILASAAAIHGTFLDVLEVVCWECSRVVCVCMLQLPSVQ